MTNERILIMKAKAGKHKYQVEFYTAHDLDIITFKNCYKVNLCKALYCSLKAFCKGETFVIKLPKKREEKPTYRRKYRCILTLDEKKDKQEIELLSKLAKGYRTNFLKNLLRMYLRTPLMEPFLNNEEDFKWFMEKFEIFKIGVKQADAASMKKDLEKGKFARILTDDTEDKVELSETISRQKDKKQEKKSTPKENILTEEPEENEEQIENAAELDAIFSSLF